MDERSMDYFYPSRVVTGPLSEDNLVKEINSEGVNPTIRRDLLYRLWTLRANHFDMIQLSV